MGVGRRMEWAQPRIHSERVPEEVAVEGQGENLPSGQGRRGGWRLPYLQVCTWDHVWWSLQPCPLPSAASIPGWKAESSFVKRVNILSGKAEVPPMHFGELQWTSPHSDIWGGLQVALNILALKTKPTSHITYLSPPDHIVKIFRWWEGSEKTNLFTKQQRKPTWATHSIYKHEQTPKEQQACEENQNHERERWS